MKYFSMFTGIGGFELAIQRAFDNRPNIRNGLEDIQEDSTDITQPQVRSECIGYSEIDKYAIATYEHNFGKEVKNYGDATTINTSELPDFDLLVGGFPCQAFSVAGKRAGFNDTRGTLIFDVVRILRDKRPGHFVLENVKGLLSHESGKTFSHILEVLTDSGYDVSWSIHNSKNYGVPQNRERIYLIGSLRGERRPQVFPITGADQQNIIVSGVLDTETWRKRHEQIRRFHDTKGISPTVPTGTGGGVMTKIAVDLTRRADNNHRVRVDGRVGTLDANYYKGLANQERPGVKDGARIRRLTPTECERLQGFPDNWTIGSDTQRYKQCGNAITVNVFEHVIKELIQ